MYGLVNEILANSNFADEYFKRFENRKVIGLLPIFMKIVNSNLKFGQKRKEIKKILNNNYTRNILENFDFKFVSMKFKIYFGFCKLRLEDVIFIITFIAIKLNERRR